MIYLVEGADGSGKGNLIKCLISKLIDEKHNFEYLHSRKENMNDKDVLVLVERLKDLKSKNYDVILDRSYISNMIYQKIFQDGDFVSKEVCEKVNELVDKIILALPSKEQYFKNFEKLKKERFEDYDDMSKVYLEYEDLYANRDNNILKEKDVVVYNMFDYFNCAFKYIEKIF